MKKGKLIIFSIILTLVIYGSYNLFDYALKTDNSNNEVALKVKGYKIAKKETKEPEKVNNVIEFDGTFNPYYDMLYDKEKILYSDLYLGINSYKTSIKPSVVVNKSEVQKVLEAIYYDHPEFFWLDYTYKYNYTDSGRVIEIILSFNDTIKNIEEERKVFDKKVYDIINVANNLKSDFEKEKYVHDTLINNTSYDESSLYNQSAYSAIVLGKTVCAGYTRAFQYIMTKLGIPTYYVTGYSLKTDHAWNIVVLDGEYYNVDLTWNDNLNDYTYFNVNDEQFSRNHKRKGISLRLNECNGIKYSNIL